MKLVIIICAITVGVFSSSIYSSTDENNITLITDNIMKVCDKPENAGSYWDIKVRGDGEADIKLKLANIGITGEAGFSKKEWDGIQRTVEDNKDYRDCVKSLSPLFIQKFSSLIQKENPEVKTKKKILGGVKWQEVAGGMSLTMTSCARKSSSVVCEFVANSPTSDSILTLFENSAIFDQNGNRFVSSQLSIANSKSNFRNKRRVEKIGGELVRGVDTKITATFRNVSDSSILVSKASLVSNIGQQGSPPENHTFLFRDIKISLNQ